MKRERLNPAELNVLVAAAEGRVADLAELEEATLRAEFLLALALGLRPGWKLHPAGLRVANARIQGEFNLDGGTLDAPLVLTGCRFDHGVRVANAKARSLDFGHSVMPGFRCSTTELTGDLILTGCSIGPAGGDACVIGSCDLAHSLVLDDARVAGTLDLTGTAVGRTISCRGAILSNPHGTVLQADGLQCQGSLRLAKGQHRFSCRGTIRLAHARLANLEIQDGLLLGAEGKAIAGPGLHLDGDLIIGGEVIVLGELRFIGAQIQGDVLVQGACLLNPRGSAFTLDHAQIECSVHLGCPDGHGGLRALGQVSLAAATVGGRLACVNGAYAAQEGCPWAVDFGQAEVGRAFTWSGNRLAGGGLDFGGLASASLEDELSSANYPPGRYRLNGFSYGEIDAEADSDLAGRLGWVRNADPASPHCAPQPYEQLSRCFRQAGRYEDAKTVAIERKRYLARCGQKGPVARILDRFLDWSIRYGYETWRVAIWAVVAWLVGAGVFFHGSRLGLLVASAPSPEGVPQAWIPLDPLAYSADVLVPGMDLHQQTRWEPIVPPDHRHGFARFLIIWTWVQRILGWVLTSLGIAGFYGLIKYD